MRGRTTMLGVPTDTTLFSAFAVACLATIVAFAFQESRRGLRLRASRDEPIAASALGVNIAYDRWWAFVLSAFICGIGGALYEKFLYDEFGQPLAGTFADYMMPTAREVPPVEVLITEDAPSPLNPPGVKGAGEAGINAVGAAIASAIDDALGQQIVVTRLPVTPTQIKRALQCNPGM